MAGSLGRPGCFTDGVGRDGQELWWAGCFTDGGALRWHNTIQNPCPDLLRDMIFQLVRTTLSFTI